MYNDPSSRAIYRGRVMSRDGDHALIDVLGTYNVPDLEKAGQSMALKIPAPHCRPGDIVEIVVRIVEREDDPTSV